MGTRGGSPNLPPAKVVAPAPSAISGRGGIFLGILRRALFGPKIFRKPLLLSVSRQTAAVLSLLYLLPDAARSNLFLDKFGGIYVRPVICLLVPRCRNFDTRLQYEDKCSVTLPAIQTGPEAEQRL